MRELEYPFDGGQIVRKKKAIKRQLLSEKTKSFLHKKIAILGGQTTDVIRSTLELFLLNYGIEMAFYESEYGRYYEDGMFSNDVLDAFAPDLIYVCTSVHNIMAFPEVADTVEEVDEKLQKEYERYLGLWQSLRKRFNCPIIQNNIEYPFFRLMGNMDVSDRHGRVNYVNRLNALFAEFAGNHDDFFLCDVNYISASYGLEKWSDPYYWYMYKYAAAVPAVPYLSYNVANIIKSLYGKNKKALNLDLDNTLWGGVIGDDGKESIEIGQETTVAEIYSGFQKYLKDLQKMGILLTVNSKNEEDNALNGFERNDSILKRDDFVSFKANWNPKSENLAASADELSLTPDAFVFIDDSPAEREIVRQQLPGVAVPEIRDPEHYIKVIDKSGFFEFTSFSGDDVKRNAMYQANVKRRHEQKLFSDYHEYLISLQMNAEIHEFVPEYMSRIAQLTNKSNQFNLTTRRYTQNEIEAVAENDAYITLYGRLMDKFGDNGVVSVIIGKIQGERQNELHIELWLMSCRVLKRDMEYAMMDTLVEHAKRKGLERIIGYYYPTKKNGMVRDFYGLQGFKKTSGDNEEYSVWEYAIPQNYEYKQSVIRVIGG